jgi:hypothetical protein
VWIRGIYVKIVFWPKYIFAKVGVVWIRPHRVSGGVVTPWSRVGRGLAARGDTDGAHFTTNPHFIPNYIQAERLFSHKYRESRQALKNQRGWRGPRRERGAFIFPRGPRGDPGTETALPLQAGTVIL